MADANRVEFEEAFRRVERQLERYPGLLEKHMLKAFADDGREWEHAMGARFRAPLHTGPGPNPNKTLHQRTGRLQRSLGSKAIKRRGVVSVKVFSSGVDHAARQEFGGEITPKRARWLTIPLQDNMTPAGVTRQTASRAIAGGAYFWHNPRSKKLLIVKKDANDELRFLFVLKKKVTIPSGRLGFFATWDLLKDKRDRRRRDAASAALREGRTLGGGR